MAETLATMMELVDGLLGDIEAHRDDCLEGMGNTPQAEADLEELVAALRTWWLSAISTINGSVTTLSQMVQWCVQRELEAEHHVSESSLVDGSSGA